MDYIARYILQLLLLLAMAIKSYSRCEFGRCIVLLYTVYGVLCPIMSSSRDPSYVHKSNTHITHHIVLYLST